MKESHRSGLGAGLALAVALGLGFIAGQSVGSAGPDTRTASEPRSCREAVERLASIEGRLASTPPASGASPLLLAARTAPGDDGAAIVAKLESLRGRVEDLMALPLCQASGADPQAAASRELAKLDDPRNREAFGDARSVVDYAIQDGRWTREDAESLRELLPLLTGKQQEEVLATLLPELNSNLEVDFFPPF